MEEINTNTSNNIYLCLAGSELMKGLSPETTAVIFDKCMHLTLSKKDSFYRQGNLTKYIFLVCEGTIKLTHLSGGEREMINEIAWPGQLLGEWANYGEENRQENAVVISNTASCLRIKKEEFMRFLNDIPVLRKNLRAIIREKYRAFVENSHRIVRLSATERIHDFLLTHINTNGRKVGFEIAADFPFTHQDVASITGTSRQTVTTLISRYRKENLIYLNRGRLLIRDFENFNTNRNFIP